MILITSEDCTKCKVLKKKAHLLEGVRELDMNSIDAITEMQYYGVTSTPCGLPLLIDEEREVYICGTHLDKLIKYLEEYHEKQRVPRKDD
jgi:hypothetical protein